MNKIVISIFCFFITIGAAKAQVPFNCTGQTYMTLEQNGSTQVSLVQFNQFTGGVSLNAIFPDLNISINAIGYRSTDNLIYGLNIDTRALIRIDATGNVETLSNLNLDPGLFYAGADVTPDGRYLVLIGGAGFAGTGIDIELAKVDLESPNYTVSKVSLSGPVTRAFDIAYDPATGDLYGFDSNVGRIFIVDDVTGAVSAPFPQSDLLNFAGALFFNAFGNLFAYGAANQTSGQNTLIGINKNTGAFRFLTTGDTASETDGCSCPYTIEITKSVNVESAFPCSQIEYTFAIANSSFIVNSGITFEDVLPPGFKVIRVYNNPFGGIIEINSDSSQMAIRDMIIPPGVDSFRVRVEIGEVPLGIYNNQAILKNLPASLGGERLSDDPSTLLMGDSTALNVTEIPFDTLVVDEIICAGESLNIDVGVYGSIFEWQDGSNESTFEITEEGMYAVTVSSPCDTTYLFYNVTQSDIEVEISISDSDVVFGDTVNLSSSVFNTADLESYVWSSSVQSFFSCIPCPNPSVVSFFDNTFILSVTNEDGCSDQDEISLIVERDFTTFIPNTFTPNQDGINDEFYVFTRTRTTIEIFDIFDRWGNKVFSAPTGSLTNNPSEGWNGRVKGQEINAGVFAYVAKVVFPDGTIEINHGNVTLLR